MSGFASANDLNKQDDQQSSHSLSVSAPEVEEKFQKKMKKITLGEQEKEAARLAASIGYPHIDLEKFPINQEALRQMSKEQAEQMGAVCFYATPDEVRVGALDPAKEEVQELLYDISERNHANGGLYVISSKSLEKVLKLYDTLPSVKPISKDLEIKAADLEQVQATVKDFKSFQQVLEKKTATDLLTLLLGVALKLGASDLHVEAEQARIVVRLRLDGILHDAAVLPKDLFIRLISRLKLVSSLKINITDKPQDGRFTIKLSGGDVDVRVSTLPTVYGESAVMRLLRQSREGLSFDKIGLRGDVYDKLKREIERPNGMIINTGPTGSGKTTTMYAILKVLNKPGVKIITLEDPVEYKMEGINQSQVDPSHDYTFAKGLRSILRQDPDIVMVGEIRDLETAEIAVQAALTGHLMLSTIHTNSAAGAIPRFLSMGIKPFLLAPALNAIIGQRLVRLLCPACKITAELTAEQQKRVEEIMENMPEKEKMAARKEKLVFYQSRGCEKCHDIGYQGRTGLYEILLVSPEIQQMILSSQVSEYDLEKTAIQQGMLTMVQDGVLKAQQGITSLEEVFRVID